LKFLAAEIKKKQNLIKNKEDSRKVFDELCKKYLNQMFWADIEKPLHKLFLNSQSDNAFLNFIMKKGMAKAGKEEAPQSLNKETSKEGNSI
jgi:hypothetical protein